MHQLQRGGAKGGGRVGNYLSQFLSTLSQFCAYASNLFLKHVGLFFMYKSSPLFLRKVNILICISLNAHNTGNLLQIIAIQFTAWINELTLTRHLDVKLLHLFKINLRSTCNGTNWDQYFLFIFRKVMHSNKCRYM